MSLFGKFIGGRKFEGKHTFVSSNPDEMLKAATALKKDGDINGAILKLRAAYEEIKKTNVIYDVTTFLRLPQYLHVAGKNDEAWREFNNLLLGFPNQLASKEVLPMSHSIIYDSMRLFLQREKVFSKAILFSMFSYICWAKGLHLQKRKRELEEYLKRKTIESSILPAVKKAKMADSLIDYCDIIEREVKYLPDIDLSRVEREFRNITPNAR